MDAGAKVFTTRWLPVGLESLEYQWFTTRESTTSKRIGQDRIDGICFERFLEEFRQHTGADRIGLVLDNSGSHTSGKVRWPDGLEKIPLPPYSPELNPAEHWFEALRRIVANAIFDTLEDLEAALTEALRPYWQNLPSSSAWSAFHGGVAP